MQLKLHPTGCRKLKPLDGRTTEYRDLVVPGLVLRVTPRGYRSLCVRYRRGGRQGRHCRITFGSLSRISLAKARKLAREVFRVLAAGQDPRPATRTTAPLTVDELVGRCLERLELRVSSRREWRRLAKAEISPALGSRPIAELTRAEVRLWLAGLAARSGYTANNSFRLLRRVFSWAISQELVASSPCAGLGTPAAEARNDRWLRAPELRALSKALESFAAVPLYPDVVRLLLLTGLRRGEALAARREEFHDLEGTEARWIVPAARMKNGLEHVVPLSRQAVALVKARLEAVTGAHLFPAPGEDVPAPWRSYFVDLLRARVLELVREELEDPEAEVARWTIHGLRHTLATHMQDTLKVPDDVVALILAHRPPGVTDVDLIYLRGRKLEERRRALQRWADYLEGLAAAKPEQRIVAGSFGSAR